jgi:hypothetical protein
MFGFGFVVTADVALTYLTDCYPDVSNDFVTLFYMLIVSRFSVMHLSLSSLFAMALQ